MTPPTNRIAMIHGIGQQQKSASALEAEWRPALATGLESAGFAPYAQAIRTGTVPSEMTFYGDLFLQPGAMGPDDGFADDAEQELVIALAEEWLNRAAHVERDPKTKRAGEEAVRLAAEHGAQAMGPKGAVRRVFRHLAKVPWLAKGAVGAAQRTVVRDLRQVASYLTNRMGVRDDAQARFDAVASTDANIVIGHSLGSVVAYEACHRLGRPIDLLVTLGSPLGLNTIVYERLAVQPAAYPPNVARWVNVADTDDIVAADPRLEAFVEVAPDGALENRIVDNGDDPHAAVRYLSQPDMGSALGEALQ